MASELGQLQGRLAAPTLLVTKLHPPFVPAQVVTRDRLFRRLSEAQRARLSLVACPAGFGKSTLLAAWREHESRERPVGWVSVDEGDNDAVVLWLHIVEALARVCPELDGSTLAATFAAAPHVEVALPRLVNALAEQRAVALVLDDFHRLTSRSTRDTVAWFVDKLPPNVQLVIASRTDPALPLGALRARGQLLELRADDLRFSADEAEEFLNERLELELTDDDIALLVGRTEGWPAGIYLAALSLAGKDDKSALVREFDGASAHIVDFLAGEVLAGFDPELQTFMLRTSVLERLCAPLCDAVLHEPGAASALGRLAQSNLFLIPLDDQRRWYRFHHLFAQILRLELERREPGTAPELHRRAFNWHTASGTTGEAIHHAVAAGEFDAAGLLISESWNEHANAGRIRSILEWLDAFPEEVLAADHELLMVKAWASAMVGRREDQLAALDQALGLFISGSTDNLMPPAIQQSNAKHYKGEGTLTEVRLTHGLAVDRAARRSRVGREGSARGFGFTLATRLAQQAVVRVDEEGDHLCVRHRLAGGFAAQHLGTEPQIRLPEYRSERSRDRGVDDIAAREVLGDFLDERLPCLFDATLADDALREVEDLLVREFDAEDGGNAGEHSELNRLDHDRVGHRYRGRSYSCCRRGRRDDERARTVRLQIEDYTLGVHERPAHRLG